MHQWFCRLSCCVAGNQNSTPVEGQLRETLELLAERHGLPMPQAASPPWLPHGHPHARIEVRHLRCLGVLVCCCLQHAHLNASQASVLTTCTRMSDTRQHLLSQTADFVRLVHVHREADVHQPVLPPLSRVCALLALQVALRHGGACDRCSALARLLIATPCAHLLCVGCAGGDRYFCAMQYVAELSSALS